MAKRKPKRQPTPQSELEQSLHRLAGMMVRAGHTEAGRKIARIAKK